MIPVILCGGSGTRLWPISREMYPKQFLKLVGDRTLLQETVLRLHGIPLETPPLVIANEEHRFLVAEQMREIDTNPLAILLEPVGRNTAPAVAVAAIQALQKATDPVLLVLPADHVIEDTAAFQEAVRKGMASALEGKLVTFGIKPTQAATGYGYIRTAAAGGTEAQAVEAFVEKPDQATARGYLESGRHLWNSGMFMFRAQAYLDELERLAPQILEPCREAMRQCKADMDFTRIAKEPFNRCESDSIDYAVMEKTDKAVVVPLDAGWNDVGSWSAIMDVSQADADGNVRVGDVMAIGARNCYLRSESRLVAALGLEDCIVVETDDAVLVADKAHIQDVKQIVQQLKSGDRSERLCHNKVPRPWGTYDSMVCDGRFQVKHIIVKPGAQLSLQLHHHRAEHWIVVRGTARITRGEESFILAEDQSTYIPLGVRHRIENPGKIPLEIIEVQTGSYLGEDDIVRFEDTYGR